MSGFTYLSVQPLAPTPELFIRGIRNYLQQNGDTLSLDLIPVFPFQDRSDGMDYDEQLFQELFRFAGKLRPVLDLSGEFRTPGKFHWISGLDEDGDEGLPFLVRRVAAVLADMEEISAAPFHGLDIVSSGKAEYRRDLERRLAAESSYHPENINWIEPGRLRPLSSRWTLLPAALWEEQLALLNGAGEAGEPLFAALSGLQQTWMKYLQRCARRGLTVSRALINRLRDQGAPDGWPFGATEHAVDNAHLSVGPAGAGDTDPAFLEVLEGVERVIKPRSEARWYRDFILTLKFFHRGLSAALMPWGNQL